MDNQSQMPCDDEPSPAEVETELQKIVDQTQLITYLDYRHKMDEHPDLSQSDSKRARMARLLAKGD